MDEALLETRNVINEISETEKLTKKTYGAAEKIIDNIITDLNTSEIKAINLLKNLKTYDEYIYQHSVNVGILAAIFARLKGSFSNDEIKFLALGAYLLDIGLTKIDKKLLNKDSKYTPDEMRNMKLHPQFGYEILKDIPGINPIVLQTVLFHHEKFNYKGYYQLPYEMLPISPKIVSVCDIYDALTTRRPYREAVSATNALKFLVNSINVYFDYQLISDFVNILGPLLNNAQSFYARNDFCVLNTKELAMITDFSVEDYMKPHVMIFCKFQKKDNLILSFYEEPVFIDLKDDDKRYITKILDNKNLILAIRSKLIKKGMIEQ